MSNKKIIHAGNTFKINIRLSLNAPATTTGLLEIAEKIDTQKYIFIIASVYPEVGRLSFSGICTRHIRGIKKKEPLFNDLQYTPCTAC